MAENPSTWKKEINIQTQEAQKIQKGINPKKSMPRYSIIKLLKSQDKEKILKVFKDKHIN